MANYINQIYATFHNLPDSHVLIIKGSEKQGYTFAASPIYNETVAIRTQKLFKKIFRELPVQEILEQHPASRLTKAVLRQIFVKMAVFGDEGPPLNFSTLSEFEHIFLDKAPKAESFFEDKAKTSGKGFEGLCEKVYLEWHHYFSTQLESNPEKVEIRQAEFLTSRMSDRELQEGAYLYLGKKEIFQVDRIIIREGAYISILKNISNPTEIKIICRGTAMRSTATDGLNSGLNDLQYEIGNGGIQAVWPIISDYLTQQNTKEVQIYGKSLGGAHAQRLAILIMNLPQCLLKSLTTVCSVGVGSEAEGLFKSLVEKDQRYRNLNLTVIRNGGETQDGADYIPCVGGDHLGATVDSASLNLRVFYIHPTSKQIFPPNQNLNFFQKGVHFVSSFTSAHVRQTTLADFSYERLDNRQAAQSALKLGATLEGPRRRFAYKNAIPFTNFVNSTTLPPENNTAKKIVTLVSSIFLVLFFTGFIVCLTLRPGSIVYQGNGIILTLPAVIMAGGGGLSVITIAIGSCCWWLSSKKSNAAHPQISS